MIIYMNIKTNIMSYKTIESREIVFCYEDDRHILIVRENDEIVGLNYMQGDELECFKKGFMDIDYELTDFYTSVKDYLSGKTEVERINQAIWANFDYKNRKDGRKNS